MEKITLHTTKREAGKNLGQMRRDGLVPAVIYGQGKEPQALTVSLHDFIKVFREAGHSTIIQLNVEDSGQKNVLIHRTSSDPVKGTPTHIDFLEISMKEKITTKVPLAFIGESSAVIELGGNLVTNKDEVEIECLPGNLPQEIEVDLTPLVDFEVAIHVSDIVAPTGVEIKDEAEEMIATVEPPRSEEEMAELEEPVGEQEMPEAEQGEAEEETKEESQE